MKTKDVGVRNTKAIVHYIAKFGYLNARQIELLIFDNKSSSKILAHKKLEAMLKSSLLKRQLINGTYYYYLSKTGCSLAYELHGMRVKYSKPKFQNLEHRQGSNNFLIDNLVRNRTRIYSEHEIQVGLAPFKSFETKVPDGLIVSEGMVTWIEVENTYKNVAERNKCASFCADYLSDTKLTCLDTLDEHYLESVLFVCLNREALKRMAMTLKDYVVLGRIGEVVASEQIFFSLYTEEYVLDKAEPRTQPLSKVLEVLC